MMLIIGLLLFVIPSILNEPLGEHKVHNIILNPEKYSRCQTTKIQQIVASPGYEPITIDNNVCVGWCYSYSIPSTQPAEPGELIGPYCDSCQPIETTCYHVTLKSDGKDPEILKLFKKRVQIIKRCSCMSCAKVKNETCDLEETLELPENLFSQNVNQDVREEVPELLHIPKGHNSSRLNALIKTLQTENNLVPDEAQLNKFLTLIDNDLPDSENINLKDLFKKINPSLDLVEQNSKNNLKVEQDLQKFHLPPTFGIEAHQIKHHLGEPVHVGMDLGRLVRGPHGSMVLAPDLKVEEKLNIDSDGLKPNHDGVVIEYENHRKRELLIN